MTVRTNERVRRWVGESKATRSVGIKIYGVKMLTTYTSLFRRRTVINAAAVQTEPTRKKEPIPFTLRVTPLDE